MEFDANNLKISVYIYLILSFGPPRFPVSTLPSMAASPLHGPPWSTCYGARGSEWFQEPHPLTSAGLRETPRSGRDRPWSVAAHRDRQWPRAGPPLGPAPWAAPGTLLQGVQDGGGPPFPDLIGLTFIRDPCSLSGKLRELSLEAAGTEVPWTPALCTVGLSPSAGRLAGWMGLAGTPSPGPGAQLWLP